MAALKQNKSLDFFKQNAIYFVLLILLGSSLFKTQHS